MSEMLKDWNRCEFLTLIFFMAGPGEILKNDSRWEMSF